MTASRWLALLGLAAALALTFFFVIHVSSPTGGAAIASDDEAPAARGEAGEAAVLDDVGAEAPGRAEVEVAKGAGATTPDAAALVGAKALDSTQVGVLRVELVGPGAGHSGAVLGEDFIVYGADDPYEGSPRTTPIRSEDGSYLFAGIEPSDVRWVGLDAQLFIDALVPVPALVAGETLGLELPVARGVSAAGVVLDGKGKPIEGARVRLCSWERPDLSSSIGFEEDTHTDEEGRFLVGGVLPGEVTLRVSCDGFEGGSKSLGPMLEGEFADDVTVHLTGGGAVTGVVLWPDGSPAAKASVRLVNAGDDWSDASKTKTDGEGAFEFTGLRGAAFRVAASAKKKRSRWRWRAEGVASIGQRIQLEFEEGVTLVGSARNDLGEPLAEFKVIATPVGLHKGGGSGSVTVEDGDGTFERKGLEPGSYDVFVTAKEHTAARPVRVTLPAVGARVDVVLDRLASASGVVVDTEGQPLGALGVRIGGQLITTDGEGRFELIGVDAGSLAVALPSDTSGVVRSEPVVIDPGEARDDIVIVVGRGATVRCKLHPSLVGGIYTEATLRPENTFQMGGEDFDSEGVAEFTGLKAGMYWVALPSVKGREWVDTHRDTHPVPVEVMRDSTVTVTVGAPDAYPIQVRGQVTRRGELQSALLIYVYGTEVERTFPAAIGRTDAEGRYELRLRTAGEYTFNVGEGQMAQARFMVQVTDEPEQERDFSLPDAELRGRAAFADGTPAVGRMYVLVHADAPLDTKQAGDLQFAGTSSDGSFRFTGLHPGRYRLHTGNYFSEHDADGLVVVEDIEVLADGETPELSIVIPRAAVLLARAVDQGGRPLGGHAIVLETPSGAPHFFYPRTTTDAQGYQRVRGIGPGPWRVVVRHPAGRVVGTETIDIAEGESLELTVACSP